MGFYFRTAAVFFCFQIRSAHNQDYNSLTFFLFPFLSKALKLIDYGIY